MADAVFVAPGIVAVLAQVPIEQVLIGAGEEGAAAAGGVEDAQFRRFLRRPPFQQRADGVLDDVVDDVAGRVIDAAGFADFGFFFDRDIGLFTIAAHFDDFAEWTPALNRCWFADTIIKVKFKYRLTVDSREKAALKRTLLSCRTVSMIFTGTARSVVATSAPARQPASSSQQQQLASNTNTQSTSGDWRQWDTNGNGRITCAEARAAGIAPVHRGHPAYPRMDDRDNDGVVCE